MSSALAIASVTAVLKTLLINGLMRQSSTISMGDVAITALPPDRIPVGAEERDQLNLYLYRLTPNSGWHRMNTAAVPTEAGRSLALDLHYLLTAYGERDLQAEILLGYAIQILHETPTLASEAIRSILTSASMNGNKSVGSPALAALSTATLADQVEQIKVNPEFLGMEEMSKLWSTLQTRSRLSVAYQVSTIVIRDRHASTTM